MPSEPGRRRAEPFSALLITVGWAACVFAAWGGMSLALDRDPAPPEADRFFGIGEFLASGIAVWIIAAVTARSRHPWWGALGAFAAVELASLAVAVPYGVPAMGSQALSPFIPVAAILASGAVILTWQLSSHGPQRRV